MKQIFLILLFVFSANSYADVGCNRWLPTLPDMVKTEIEKTSEFKVKSIQQLTDVKKMKFWDNNWGPKLFNSKIQKYDRGEGIDKSCGTELHLSLIKGKNILTAVCLANVLFFRTGEIYYTLDNCEEFTEDKTLATTLNGIGKLPSK